MIDLRPEHLAIVRNILQIHVPDRVVEVFGSRVQGRTKKASDLDLVIMGDNPLDIRTFGNLQEAFSESDLPMKVDIVEWARTSASFRKIIEEQKVKFPKIDSERPDNKKLSILKDVFTKAQYYYERESRSAECRLAEQQLMDSSNDHGK